MHEALSTFGSYALEALAPILAALLAMLLLRALKWAGVKVNAAQELQVDTVAAKAVDFVNQWARAKVKLGEPTPSQQERAAKAVDFGRKALGANLPDDFTDRVEVQLGILNRNRDK